MAQDRTTAQTQVRIEFPRNARWNFIRRLDDEYIRPQVESIIRRYVVGDQEITAVRWGTDKITLGAIVGDNLNLKVDVQEKIGGQLFVVLSVDSR